MRDAKRATPAGPARARRARSIGRAEYRRLPADHLRRHRRAACPGQKFTFGVVKAAQACGDFHVLADVTVASCAPSRPGCRCWPGDATKRPSPRRWCRRSTATTAVSGSRVRSRLRHGSPNHPEAVVPLEAAQILGSGKNMSTPSTGCAGNSAGGVARVLVIDVSGTNVKVLATEQRRSRRFASGPTMTAEQMVAGVSPRGGLEYDVIVDRLSGAVIVGGPCTSPGTWAAGG